MRRRTGSCTLMRLVGLSKKNKKKTALQMPDADTKKCRGPLIRISGGRDHRQTWQVLKASVGSQSLVHAGPRVVGGCCLAYRKTISSPSPPAPIERHRIRSLHANPTDGMACAWPPAFLVAAISLLTSACERGLPLFRESCSKP